MPRWFDRLIVVLVLIAAGATFPGPVVAFTTVPAPQCPPVITEPVAPPRESVDA